MQQYFASQQILTPAEFYELGLAISTYEQTGECIELKTKVATALFVVIAKAIDNEREVSDSISDKRREAGKKGAEKRWKKEDADSKEVANNSKVWQNGNAIFAIQGHSEPLFDVEQEEGTSSPSDGSPISSSPTPPSYSAPSFTPTSTPEEQPPQEKETPLTGGKRKKTSPSSAAPPPKKAVLDKEFIDGLVQAGVEEQVAKDWLAQRDIKNLKSSPTALRLTIREFGKVPDRTPNELIEFCIVKGWGGFKAEYYTNAIKKEYDNGRNLGNSKKGIDLFNGGEKRNYMPYFPSADELLGDKGPSL